MMGIRDRIKIDDLITFEDAYLKFEKTNIFDIKRIWQQSDDTDYDEAYLSNEILPYKWEDPLYMKMIHRFRNCRSRIAVMCHQIDLGNQRLLILHQLLPFITSIQHSSNPSLGLKQSESKEILRNVTNIESLRTNVEFFAWLSNMLGAHEIKPDELQSWNLTPITWFYKLSLPEKTSLVERFNKDEIDAYNNYVMADRQN